MKRFIIWCRWTDAAGEVPDERDKAWNLVTPLHSDLWGFDTLEQAESRACKFRSNWQPGFMETHVSKVELPD